jgi:hypothetical protein
MVTTMTSMVTTMTSMVIAPHKRMYRVRNTRMALGNGDFMGSIGSGQDVYMAFLNRLELLGRGYRGRLDNNQGG